jgi:hypothetical protein
VAAVKWRTDFNSVKPPFLLWNGTGGSAGCRLFQAHRYELNVAAVSKAGMGTGGSACLRRFSGAQLKIQCRSDFYSEMGLHCYKTFRRIPPPSPDDARLILLYRGK